MTAKAPLTASKPTSPITDLFKAYAQIGDTGADGKTINMDQIQQWMISANIVDGEKNMAEIFKKFKANAIEYNQFSDLIDEMADSLKIKREDFMAKLTAVDMPAMASVAKVENVSGPGLAKPDCDISVPGAFCPIANKTETKDVAHANAPAPSKTPPNKNAKKAKK